MSDALLPMTPGVIDGPIRTAAERECRNSQDLRQEYWLLCASNDIKPQVAQRLVSGEALVTGPSIHSVFYMTLGTKRFSSGMVSDAELISTRMSGCLTCNGWTRARIVFACELASWIVGARMRAIDADAA
jgi:hypothetical protein